MQNVQQLLDELGSPPTEVCLDWAWQLIHLSERPDCPQSFNWSDLQISRQGSLEISLQTIPHHRDTTSTTNDTHELIRRLLQWAGLDDSELSSVDTLDACRSALESLTGQCVNGQARSNTLPTNSRSVEKREILSTGPVISTVEAGIAQQEPATSLDLAEKGSNQLEAITFDNSSTAQSSIERPSKNTAKAKSRHFNNRRLLLAGVCAAVVLSVTSAYFVMGFGNTKSDTLAAKDTKTTSEASGVSKPSDSSTKPKSKSSRSKSAGSELDDLLSGSGSAISGNSASSNELSETTTTPEITSLDGGQPRETSLSLTEGTSSASKSLGSLAPNNRPQDDPSTSSPQETSNTQNEQSDSVSIEDKTEGSSLSKTVEANAAVAATSKESVAGLLKSVTSDDTKVNTLDAGTDQDGPPKLPVQLLNVESMFQVQELPAKIRVRQPVWQLRIESTAAFTVDPPGLQSLSEKETVRWILTAKELKPRKGQEPTQVVVLAQLTGRKADIRWTVAAGSQDTPGIAVPLNESSLDQMLSVLQGYQQRLTMGIDQIKTTVEIVEIPREQKTLLTAQRKAMENEGKLVTRARQVIADASMFASWMDRSLEVHGVLTDQIGGQPTVVLELGQPVVAEPKLKSDDSDDVAPADTDQEPAVKK